MNKKYLAIDEEGFLVLPDSIRLTDLDYGKSLLSNIKQGPTGAFVTSSSNNEELGLDVFDEPLLLQNLELPNEINSKSEALGLFNYQFNDSFKLSELFVDEWDRFHGLTNKGVPFVFSRKAQAELFNQCESFEDDSFTIKKTTFQTKNYFQEDSKVQTHSFWSNTYLETQFKPGWDLGAAHPALLSITTQLKLVKSRILVLGCGAGHDCALFAQQGHVVTGIDFSAEAIHQAKKNYGHLPIQWIQTDIFKIPEALYGSFDIVFDHTLYCAISPSQRKKLVMIWKKLLIDRGHLLGIFFSMFKPQGPPYGGSEWELRERMNKHFDFRYWSRWRHSPKNRENLEFVVYAQKKGD